MGTRKYELAREYVAQHPEVRGVYDCEWARASADLQAELRPTPFGLANSFTRAAQRLQPIERMEVERLAGRLLAAQT